MFSLYGLSFLSGRIWSQDLLHEEDFATSLQHPCNLPQCTPNNCDTTNNTCRHAVSRKKTRQDYACRRQFNEKPRIILGCPNAAVSTRCWVQGNYLEAECVNVDPVGKSITCRYNKPFRGHSNEFTGREFNVPYDVLVVAVSLLGATNSV